MTARDNRESFSGGLSFLLAPLGWLVGRLAPSIDADPTLFRYLFGLSKTRMHLIATALAHSSRDVTQEEAVTLLQGSYRTVMDQTLHKRPVGIKRALAHLPPEVLQPQTYIKLVSLLSDRRTATFLHHQMTISEKAIVGMDSLPLALRRPHLLKMFGGIEGMDKFMVGLECLAARAGIPCQELVNQIGVLNQTAQVVAKIVELVEDLPVREGLPPAQVGAYRRLDHARDIHALANRWHNCVATFISSVDDGTCAIYQTEPPDPPAACIVQRVGRLGWFLQQARGPNNKLLSPQHLSATASVFADCDIRQITTINAIRHVIHSRECDPLPDYD
jgi:hypothetical protein